MVAALAVPFASAVTEIIITERAPHTAKEVRHGAATVYEPATRFSCGDSVYFAMDAEPYRGQTLTLTWTGPTGKTREVVRETIGENAHGWLAQLRLSKGMSLTGFIDPSSGYDGLAGTWTVKLDSLWAGEFEVLC